MAAKTRLGGEGYGVKREASFAGKNLPVLAPFSGAASTGLARSITGTPSGVPAQAAGIGVAGTMVLSGPHPVAILTRSSADGYGVRRYLSFAGKTSGGGSGPHPVGVITRASADGYGVRRYLSFAGKTAAVLGISQAAGVGTAGQIRASVAGSMTGAIGTGVARTAVPAVAKTLDQASGTGTAGQISFGTTLVNVPGVTGTGVANSILTSAYTFFGVAGIGRAGTIGVSGADKNASVPGVTGTGIAGAIVGFSSTAPLPGGSSTGSGKPKKPTSFVPIERKGGYQEPKLEDRVVVKRPAPKPIELPEPEPVAELPPVLLETLKGVVDPVPIEFESDEDAVARALELYLGQENKVRGAIASAATDIITSMISEIIADLEAETA